MKTLIVWLERLSSRHVVLGLSVAGALFVQSAILPHLAVFGLKPDLLMVVVASWGLLFGPREGFVAGLAAGLTQDVVFGQYIGLFALAKTVVGFFCGVVEGKIFKETIWVPTAAIGLAVFAHEVIVWVSLRGLHVPAPAFSILAVALPGAVYSMLLAPLVYRELFVYRLKEWAKEKEMAGGGASQASGKR